MSRRPLPSGRPSSPISEEASSSDSQPEPEPEEETETEEEEFLGPPIPEYEVGTREVIAVEHPAIIQNLDNGVKTFGKNQPFERIIYSTDPEECIPLYLRFRDPSCPPILSQKTQTDNILLKITLPKKTGRRRKKGSQDPFTDEGGSALGTAMNLGRSQSSQDLHMQDVPLQSAEVPPPQPPNCSHSRMDTDLWKRIRDNRDKYECEAVGEIHQTHRFRGLTDFHQSTTHAPFFSRFRDTALTGDLQKMRQFKFDPSRNPKPNEEIILPTNMTIYPLPFNWSWQQESHITEQIDPDTGERILVNTARYERLQVEYLPAFAESIPKKPSQEPPEDDELREIISQMKKLFVERPIWTRRAIINKINYAMNEATMHLIKLAIPYVGYRFSGGPFRDAIIEFGLDPRKDPKYRMYQTIYFQLVERVSKDPAAPWAGIRKSTIVKKPQKSNDKLSHFFDGRSVAIDGKIWQMCDVSDPLLARMIKEAPTASIFDAKNDGWFCNGSLAKIRAIMKVKIIALQTGRVVQDEDFHKALEMPDIIPDKEGRQVWIPVPDIRLSKEEMERLRASGKDFTIMSGMIKERKAYNGRLRRPREEMDDGEGSERKRPWDWQANKLRIMAKRIKTGEAAEDSMDGRPSSMESTESIDPQLLADQVSGFGIREHSLGSMRDHGGYGDLFGDGDGSRDSVETPRRNTQESQQSASRGESHDADADADAESIDMVTYNDSPPSQLASGNEGAP